MDDALTLPRARFCSNDPLCIEEAGLQTPCDATKTPSCLFPLPTPSPQTPCTGVQPWWWAVPSSSFASCAPEKERLWEPLVSFDQSIPSLPARQFHYDVATQQSSEVPVLRLAPFVC